MISVLCLLVATDTNYQNYITGGRAAGLGGAFTAIANDASGLIFNPAGIVDDRHTDFSVSANLYGFDRTQRGSLPPVPIPDLSNIAQAASELVIIPSTSGFVRTFQKDPEGDGYLNAIALGVMVPSYQETNESAHTTRDGRNVDYKRTSRDRVLMPGLGYARKLGRFRLGISTFFMLRTIDTEENLTQFGDASFRIADSTTKLTSGSLLWVLGAKWFASDAVQLGLSLSLPSLPVFSNASVRYYRGAYDSAQSPAPSSFTDASAAQLSSSFQSPAALRFGFAYVLDRKLTIAADVSLNFPTSYELIRAPQLANILPFAISIQRRAVVNINTGAEWMFIKDMSLSGGFYTDFASSPSLSGPEFDGPLQQQYAANIDYYGFTAAWGLYSTNSLTRIGLLYAFGKGYDVRTRDDYGRLLSDTNQFERVELTKSSLYLFVSSTVRFD